MIPLTMHRWVERNGTRLEFGNMVGGFCGQPYKYKCRTVALAKKAEKYLKGRDPENPNMPTAFGPGVQMRFGAKKVK